MPSHADYTQEDRGRRERRPSEVIIPWEEFRRIEEELGLDLDDEAESQLSEADADMRSGNSEAFTPFDQLS